MFTYTSKNITKKRMQHNTFVHNTVNGDTLVSFNPYDFELQGSYNIYAETRGFKMVSRYSSEIAQSQATMHKAVYSKSLSTSSKPEQALYCFGGSGGIYFIQVRFIDT
jgi:hypothetical protein